MKKITIEVDPRDIEDVVSWWRGANEAPGGCSAFDAIKGMGDAVWRLEQARRQQGGKPL